MQKARRHCETCKEIQAGYRSVGTSKLQLSPSYDTTETAPMREFPELDIDNIDSGKECAVCMERFKENDIVSWSPDERCGHVFHHECIKEWLLFHDNCPYCRITVLPVDNLQSNARSGKVSGKWGDAELLKLARQRTLRARTTYFCIEDGLISIDNPIPNQIDTRCHRRFLGSRIKSGELSKLRGSRQSKDHSVNAEVISVEVIPSPVSTDSEAGSGSN